MPRPEIWRSADDQEKRNGALVGVTLIYTSDRLPQELAEDELLDLVYVNAPEHPDCTVLKVFVFEAGLHNETLRGTLQNWWRRRHTRRWARRRLG